VSLKDKLHSLVDKLPESEQRAAQRFLEFLCASRGYDDPLSPEEAAGSDRAWQDHMEGRDAGVPLEEVRRKLSAR
jgi:hypothetical protein